MNNISKMTVLTETANLPVDNVLIRVELNIFADPADVTSRR
jgi:hypothetical protein